MIQAGWCPYTVKLQETDLELDCQAYAFSLSSTRITAAVLMSIAT